jgi:hypothetical protein
MCVAQLEPLDPTATFRTPLLGNYSASVLVLALKQENISAEYHDHRKP